jgi:undecaprenyl diphosphate synthase
MYYRESIRKHQVAVRIVGDLSLLPADTLKAAREAMELTKDFKQYVLSNCLRTNL